MALAISSWCIYVVYGHLRDLKKRKKSRKTEMKYIEGLMMLQEVWRKQWNQAETIELDMFSVEQVEAILLFWHQLVLR